MYQAHTVAVIMPALNEERLIARALAAVPSWVDRIFVVDDGSRDRTSTLTRQIAARDARVKLLRHPRTRGVGRSLGHGYLASRHEGWDLTVVMAGDAQMDPRDLPGLLEPLVRGRADYVKGERFSDPRVCGKMPRHRWLGNHLLAWLTPLATGFYHLTDPQCGYTALGRRALAALPWPNLLPGYGYNAQILYFLYRGGFRVAEAPVAAVYGEERSKIRLAPYALHIMRLLTALAWQRWRFLAGFAAGRRVRRAYQATAGGVVLALAGSAWDPAAATWGCVLALAGLGVARGRDLTLGRALAQGREAAGAGSPGPASGPAGD
ncbi:MAG: glycosyltransferase family 2 protein [Deltaproteobacteria bacterium]|nr:glycosyltransferase family 2 protein [Deltaproteobacteria bacterium]